MKILRTNSSCMSISIPSGPSGYIHDFNKTLGESERTRWNVAVRRSNPTGVDTARNRSLRVSTEKIIRDRFTTETLSRCSSGVFWRNLSNHEVKSSRRFIICSCPEFLEVWLGVCVCVRERERERERERIHLSTYGSNAPHRKEYVAIHTPRSIRDISIDGYVSRWLGNVLYKHDVPVVWFK